MIRLSFLQIAAGIIVAAGLGLIIGFDLGASWARYVDGRRK